MEGLQEEKVTQGDEMINKNNKSCYDGRCFTYVVKYNNSRFERSKVGTQRLVPKLFADADEKTAGPGDWAPVQACKEDPAALAN